MPARNPAAVVRDAFLGEISGAPAVEMSSSRYGRFLQSRGRCVDNIKNYITGRTNKKSTSIMVNYYLTPRVLLFIKVKCLLTPSRSPRRSSPPTPPSILTEHTLGAATHIVTPPHAHLYHRMTFINRSATCCFPFSRRRVCGFFPTFLFFFFPYFFFSLH